MNLQALSREAYLTTPVPDALALEIDTETTTFRVGSPLHFKVSASKACELQVLYVEDDGNVEDIPQKMVGARLLEPGDQRTIPVQSTGDLIFDEPGKLETLVILCRVGGLADQRLDKAKALEMAKTYRQQFKIGLKAEIQKRILSDPANIGFAVVDFAIVK